MKNKFSGNEQKTQEQMIDFIIQRIKGLDGEMLRKVYHFILHIS